MKLRGQNVAISRISSIIAMFIDHFDLDIDCSRLPSSTTISRICRAELDLIDNAQLGFLNGSVPLSVPVVHGHDGTTLGVRKLLSNQVYLGNHVLQLDVSEIADGTAATQAAEFKRISETIQEDASAVLPANLLGHNVPMHLRVVASLSDKASTESKFAKHVFATATNDTQYPVS
jgi:hypothetical protein